MNLDHEELFLKLMHEDMVAKGYLVGPMVVMFKKGVRVAAVRCRPLAGEEEKQEAFREMMSLVATLKADQCIFATDAWVVVRPRGTNLDEVIPMNAADRMDCFNIILFERETRRAWMRSHPYLKDSQRNIFYIEITDAMAKKEGEDDQAVGMVTDTMNMCWDVEDTGMTVHQHSDLLHDLGHTVILFGKHRIRNNWL